MESFDQECSSSKLVGVNILEGSVISDNYSLNDILNKYTEQVRALADTIMQLENLNLVKDVSVSSKNSNTEMMKNKNKIISGVSALLKDLKPLNYPGFQSLSSLRLLKEYEKIAQESQLLLKKLQEDDVTTKNLIERIDSMKSLMIDFKNETEKVIKENYISPEIERAITKEFNECRADMYKILPLVDPSSMLKEVLSVSVQYSNIF
ncbi:uncharacterized protein LOC126909748 [Daktulosphaira vitifoliae]|uniref:uncharacterized protein LOC126909748 n=1 Tax=Daktulosphaira vitifoliae TaxID=58002 RepID=UPI0021AABD66|nr:uncharacterized protein LOC126909748 [Daktulosphaira vitifoliae]